MSDERGPLTAVWVRVDTAGLIQAGSCVYPESAGSTDSEAEAFVRTSPGDVYRLPADKPVRLGSHISEHLSAADEIETLRAERDRKEDQ